MSTHNGSLHEDVHPGSILSNHRDGDAEVDVDDSFADADETFEAHEKIPFKFSCKKLWKFMGPGWLMSLAYLDPGNLESDLQQGAFTGYVLTYVLFGATVVGLLLQELSARLGVVTGMDLAQHVFKGYPRWLNYCIYVMMEIAIIGSDVQEVVGTAVALQILFKIPPPIGCVITAIDSFLFMFVHWAGIRYLEALICALIAVMTVCFFVNWVDTNTDGGALAHGFLPTLPSNNYWLLASGIIGAVIMPHNLYLHSGLVQSRKVNRSSPRRIKEALFYNGMESTIAIGFSFIINMCVVGVNANSFYSPDCLGLAACLPETYWSNCVPPTPDSDACVRGDPCTILGSSNSHCGPLGIASEGAALSYGVANAGKYIWALGLLAAGEAATMTCTYAGQVVMGGMIQIKLSIWKRISLTRLIALVPSLIIALSTCGSDCNTDTFNVINSFLNTLQNIQLPFAMIPLLCFVTQRKIMGRWGSGPIKMFIDWFLAAGVVVINVISIQQAVGSLGEKIYSNPGWIVFEVLMGALYVTLIIAMLWPLKHEIKNRKNIDES